MTERVLRGVFAASVLVAAFLLGGAAVVLDLPPAHDLRGAVRVLSGAGPLKRDGDPGSAFNSAFRLWVAPRTPATGVTRIVRDAVAPGYTLYTDLTGEEARLVDGDGRLLHRWRLGLREIVQAEDESPPPYEALRWEKARLFRDGSLMAVVMASNATVYGRGLIRIDRDSRLVWQNRAPIHHDFDVGPEGRIYTLAHGLVRQAPSGSPALKVPFLGDFVLVLGPNGRTRRRIDLTGAIADSPFRNIFNLVTEHANGDYFHANNIDYVTPALARTHPYAEAGQLLLSFRELDLIALLDPESARIAWAMRGPWRGQHDPDMLPDGTILVFDNNGHVGPGGRSRVLRFVPGSQEIVWRYTGTADDPLDVRARGSQQRLANGNTLITDSYAPRLIEVTPDGRIVWEYYNPNRSEEGGAGAIRSGTRIPADAIDFPFNYGRVGRAETAHAGAGR